MGNTITRGTNYKTKLPDICKQMSGSSFGNSPKGFMPNYTFYNYRFEGKYVQDGAPPFF